MPFGLCSPVKGSDRIDIEMQVRFQKHWTKRNLFYLAKMYTEDLWIGDEYESLKKCITISILGFSLTQDTGCHSVYTLRDKRSLEFSDLFEVHIIELKKPSADAGAIGEWIQLFNAESMEELNMIKTKNAGILEAREILRTLHLRNPLRLMYEQHLKEVARIYCVAAGFAPDYDRERILMELTNTSE